jgi:hypothetical protein
MPPLPEVGAVIFSFSRSKRLRIHVSIAPRASGGGSNSFASNFAAWIHEHRDRYAFEKNIKVSDRAILIADRADPARVKKARERGTLIIHRIDEHVRQDEDDYRRNKHEAIRRLNRLADITVYQSRFVAENMHPYLDRPARTEIILNGAPPGLFFPAAVPGDMIGHVSWGTGAKKRLDLLFETIRDHPKERFLLVGNHDNSPFPFRECPNAEMAGPVKRNRLRTLYHRMKCLYFPSQWDPCPNTAIEAVLCGVPVCYHPDGGTVEIVGGCGLPLERFGDLLASPERFRKPCLDRPDLHFDRVAEQYLALA